MPSSDTLEGERVQDDTSPNNSLSGTERPVELHPVSGESTVWVTGHVKNGFGHFEHIDSHRVAEGHVRHEGDRDE